MVTSMRISLLPLPLLLLPVVACDEPAAPAPAAPQEASAAPAPTPPAEAAVVLETFRFPAGELSVPSSWRPKMREETSVTALHVMPAPNVTCDVAVLNGHGSQKQAEEYLAAGANAYGGETERGPDLEVGGHKLQGIVVTRAKAFADNEDVRVEVYAALSGEDLLSVGVTRLERSEAADEGRESCLRAFAQLTSKMPPPR